MSDGMNRVILLGNLGQDPEVRYTSAGTAVLHLRLATNETYLDKNRDAQERTEWHDVVVWGPRAEGLGKVLRKGSRALIEGGLRTSSFEKEGVKRWRTEIHARELYLVGAPGQGAAPNSEERAAPRAARRANGADGAARTPEPALDELAF